MKSNQQRFRHKVDFVDHPSFRSFMVIAATLLGAGLNAQAAGRHSDFNGDGYADLAIGIPDELANERRGAVQVLYGTRTGLTSRGNQLWTASQFEGSAESPGQAGSVLESGDFNGDGYSDLAIGNWAFSIEGYFHAGGVVVMYGSADGLGMEGRQILRMGLPQFPEKPQDLAGFGVSLASGNFDGDGYDDLAIGESGRDFTDIQDAGVVRILRGSASGISEEGMLTLSQDTPGMQGIAENYEGFGGPLVTGDFDGDEFDDLAIGCPSESWDPTQTPIVGAVYVVHGSSSGPDPFTCQMIVQGHDGVFGAPGAGHYFGRALAAGDFDRDGLDDLAIGSPYESPDHVLHAGVVHVLYGTPCGLQIIGQQILRQGYKGMSGIERPDDKLGQALGAGDFDGDGYGDLVMSAFRVGQESPTTGGIVHVVYGSPDGLDVARDQIWTQHSGGIEGEALSDGHFGNAVVAGDYDGDNSQDLAIGAIYKDIGKAKGAGAVHVLYGTPTGITIDGNQFWHQDSRGLPGIAETGDNFATALR